MEAEHNEGASIKAVRMVEGQRLDRLGDDHKASVVGRSRCRAAHQLACWAVTADNIWQQDARDSAPYVGDTTTATEVLAQPLLDCGQGKNPPQQDEFDTQWGPVADGDGVAVNGDWEDRERFWRVSKDKNVRTWWEACKSTGPTLDDDCEAMETTTIKKSMNRALHPNLNREGVQPSNTCLPQRGAQLPARESTPPTNRAHSPLSEEGSINWEIPLPPADIHSRACRRWLGTHKSLDSSNITRGSTSLLHPTTCEHVTSMGGAEPLKGLHPPVFTSNGSAGHGGGHQQAPAAEQATASLVTGPANC
jgi:hypothetical protein